jgi:hypothetical protein
MRDKAWAISSMQMLTGMGDIEKLSAIGSDLRRHDIRGSSFSIFLIFVILFR